MGCEVTYVGPTELKNIPYISARVTCTINFSDKETCMPRLKIWMLSFLERSKCLNNFEAVNNPEEYFRGHENICFMIFSKKTLTSHIVFNIPLDLIYDKYYPLHAKSTSFCFTFVLVIVDPVIFD